ncbi:Hypothetical lipoprotein [Leptospira biflexa serovar Patoc strain 'Patoc 1 (Ames)']|uniref:hypothetical protein n=1 Tax=Leptospira biflexa TaxID=172 RepID=UPI000165A89C|nr:hypothetical protein [Leptospira biflexa]ABZ94921.1 Hypothetical lipoprotein [Leptospira biflexa serovar Patoc strain 'Patoc 1 (Ames)']
MKTNRKSKHITAAKLCLILFTSMFSLILVNCSKEKKDDMTSLLLAPLLYASYPVIPDLPEPTLNSVNLTIGDTAFTKTIGACRGNFGVDDTIRIPGNDLTLPAFFINRVDFTKTNNISLTAAGTFILNVMVQGGGYDPVATCPVKIMENSNTIYDIQVQNCPVDQIQAPVTPATNLISFRVRCTKGL